MLSPYDIRTEEIRKRITGNMTSYYVNKYYKSAEGNFYFYINSKGWYHIIKPCRFKYDGEFSHYEIIDYLLTKENTLRESKYIGYFNTKEECIKAIEKNLAEI